MLRFRELKERDVVIQKIQQSNLDQKILETIRDFDINKDYAILLQENNYFNRNTYLSLMQRAHEKMMHKKERPEELQLKIDHFFHSQTQKMVQEQLKYISIAVRAEECLKNHLIFHNERKNMRKMIQRSKIFTLDYQEGLTAKQRTLIREEVEEEIKQESHQVKRAGAVDENLKFGRRKKTANVFKKQA